MKIAVLLALVSGCSARAHRVYRTSMQVLTAAAFVCDHDQTQTGLAMGIREANPFLGESPGPVVMWGSLAVSLATVVGIGLLPDKVPDYYKSMMITALAAVEGSIVAWNSGMIDRPFYRCGR